MAALLRDVGDAISSSEEPNISFEAPTMYEGHEGASDAPAAAATAEVITNKVVASEELEKNHDVATDVGGTREQLSTNFEAEGNILPQSPPLFFDAPRSATTEIWDDEPSFELFEKGSKEYVWLHSTDEPTNNNSTISPLKPITTVIPVSANERPMDSPAISTPTTVATDKQIVDVSSGPSTHDKNTRKKRMAKALANRPKSNKQKFVDEVEAMYEKYIIHGKPLKRTKKDEQPKPFVKIGGFFIGYKKFLACLKPRGDMNDEVMLLCIEMFNLAHLKQSNRIVKKFMFSIHMAFYRIDSSKTHQASNQLFSWLSLKEPRKSNRFKSMICCSSQLLANTIG